MGVGEGLLVLLGILPMPNLNKSVSNDSFLSERGLYHNKVEQLKRLNGQYILIDDFHKGFVGGDLLYRQGMGDSYVLKNCSKSGKSKILKVHDLQNVFAD